MNGTASVNGAASPNGVASTNGTTPTNGTGEPDYGRRLIPHILDQRAQENPHGEAFSIPRSNNPHDGWRLISWREYANAVNLVAHQIIEKCGEPSPSAFPTIAYIGPNDARYVVIVVAAIKAGYKVVPPMSMSVGQANIYLSKALFISPRNPKEGQLSLFDKTDCRFIFFSKSHRSTIQPWLQERDMKAVEVGSIDTWFVKGDVQPFPYSKSFAEAEWDPCVVLHTSGSTGIPKPIVCKQGMLALCDALHNLPEWQGAKIWFRVWAEKSKRHFLPMPLFHAAALYVFLDSVFHWGVPVALGVPERPLSPDLVVECLDNADVDSTLLPPVILEEISHNAEHTKALAKLNIVVFGGGNLVPEAGDRLVHNGVQLSNVIGSTECFPFPIYWQKPELWRYFILNSDTLGCDWRHDEVQDVYRLVIKRKGEKPGTQGIFYTFPDIDQYDTNDYYRPHPELPNHWIYYGRSDNIIVFSNGEKLNPVTIEDITLGHPELKGAIVVGSNRFQPALILEPKKHPRDDKEAHELIERVWPLVVRANKETVAHGQIARQFIILSNPDKPFPRAGKGTVQKAATVKLYEEEIDKLYDEQGQVSGAEVPRINVESEETLVGSIQEVFHKNLGAKELEPDDDFFAGGVDSLQVINAARLLRAGLETAGFHLDAPAMATRVIYNNPTPRRLAAYILSILRSGGKPTPEGEEEHELQAMKSFWQKYTSDLQRPGPRPDPADENQTVILTGSTGMLGSYILDLLVKSPQVKRVICLNRAEDGGVKQQAKAMEERGLASNYGEKTELYHADMSRSDFGLPPDVFSRLLQEADRLIHNAWPVNFNIPIESFEPHLRSVRMVADFATQASKRVAVAFISSIGTSERWDTARGPVPEERLDDVRLPGNGYGRSKMIGGLILEDAAKVGDFPAAVIRVGQIAGPSSKAGVWNRHEWLPSIVASSIHLGALPNNLGVMDRVDWTPCEQVASLVIEVLGIVQKLHPDQITGFYHGVNPSAVTWGQLAPAVKQFYGEDRVPKLVSFKEWVDLLEKSQTEDTQSLDRNPGVKLLNFYRGMADAYEAGKEPVIWDTTRTKERSPTMKSAKAVTPELMVHWCEQWGF